MSVSLFCQGQYHSWVCMVQKGKNTNLNLCNNFKKLFCAYFPPFFYNVEVPENVNEVEAHESKAWKEEDMKL